MNFFSIAIPTYEMKGKGVDFLDFSFNKLINQNFNDFEVVISDHSKDSLIEELCNVWRTKLNIKYYRNYSEVGSSSANINNAILNSTGQWIKILFQDDFLFDENSLMITHDSIKSNLDSNWFVSSCQHSSDGYSFYREFIPHWNDKMIYGNNTISSPSVLTIKNDENKLLFDKDYIWLMDCDYYQRCYNLFGAPTIINQVTVVNRTWANQVTNELSFEIKNKEHYQILKKHNVI